MRSTLLRETICHLTPPTLDVVSLMDRPSNKTRTLVDPLTDTEESPALTPGTWFKRSVILTNPDRSISFRVMTTEAVSSPSWGHDCAGSDIRQENTPTTKTQRELPEGKTVESERRQSIRCRMDTGNIRTP